MPLTLKVEDWPEEIYFAEVVINDEVFSDVEISDDGTFTIPGEFVSGEFSVYVRGYGEENELETNELDIFTFDDEQ